MARSGRGARVAAVLALQAAHEFRRLGRIPPVTTALVAANVLLFLRPGPLPLPLSPSLSLSLSPARLCFNPHRVLRDRDPVRLLLAPLCHASEPHLLFNMLSLLAKGARLEPALGSPRFAAALAALLALSQAAFLALAWALLRLLRYDAPYYRHCSVGFSGVLFALKVLLAASPSAGDYSLVHGVPMPSRYAAWAELLLIQLLVPDASFLGHLAGILAGIIYLRLERFFSGSGSNPLALLLRGSLTVLTWPLRFLHSGSRGRLWGRGWIGGVSPSASAAAPRVWSCPVCTFDNSASLDECEMCSTARGARRGRLQLTTEEVRQRRLRRFDR